MDRLRKPFFMASLVCLLLAVLVEVGAPLLLPTQAPDRQALQAAIREEGAEDDVDINEVLQVQQDNPPTPGLSIP
jgi:hypothetical protein